MRIRTRNKPEHRRFPDPLPPEVMAYRLSPEDVCLAIRDGKRMVSISLLFNEARTLAENLLNAAEDRSIHGA